MNAALPTRAAAALSAGVPVPLKRGGNLFLRPFTLRRILALHSVESPPFYPESRYGAGLGWAATLLILAAEDDAAVSLRLARDGAADFVAGALEWAEAQGFDIEDVGNASDAVKAEWSRVRDLDRPEKHAGQEVTAAGESSRPGTATSPNSSATASAPGTGTPTPPSTPHSGS